MIKRSIFLIAVLLAAASMRGQTLAECHEWANENYPLIRQYELISKAADYTVATAKNAWLPQIALSGQATYQSDVTAFPEKLADAYKSMGIEFEGLRRDQYRVGIDISQIIWDGGATKAHTDIAATDALVQQKSVESRVYALRERINALFFGILLLQEQDRLNDQLRTMLQGNIERVRAMINGGVATESDCQTLQAELLLAEQNKVAIESAKKAYKEMLSVFTGHETGELTVPDEPYMSSTAGLRPEMELFDLRLKSLDSQSRALDASLYPRISAFAQGFYGNPGLNMFDDMLENHFSWNYIVGVRLQWNISSFYNKRKESQKIDLARQQVQVDRDMFLFNNSLITQEQSNSIAQRRAVLAQDAQIIELRGAVRRACEVKVANGVASVNDLLREITAENRAAISMATHRIELLKYMYDLKTTNNN